MLLERVSDVVPVLPSVPITVMNRLVDMDYDPETACPLKMWFCLTTMSSKILCYVVGWPCHNG